MIVQTSLPSPIDDIIIQATENGISYVGFYPPTSYISTPLNKVTNSHVLTCVAQLNEYFAHTRTEFDLELDTGGTPFQQSVWQALCSVPFGKVATYKDIAEQLNNPKAVRAVGAEPGYCYGRQSGSTRRAVWWGCGSVGCMERRSGYGLAK